MLGRLKDVPRPGLRYKPPAGAWAGSKQLFPRLARLRGPALVIAAAALLLLALWELANSSRTAERPEPEVPDFDPFEDGAGEVVNFPPGTPLTVEVCESASLTHTAGAQGTDTSNTECETNVVFPRSMDWADPTSTSFSDGMGGTTGSTARNLRLRSASGSIIRFVPFSDQFQRSSSEGGTIEARQSQTSSLTGGGGEPVALPGQGLAPARQPRPFPLSPGETGAPDNLPAPAPGGVPDPVRRPRVAPQPAPAQVPGTTPGPLPQTPAVPAPDRPPAPATVPTLPGAVPVPAVGPLPVVPLPVPNTRPGVEQTALGPVGGGGQVPPPTLQGIASEVGRVEQKLLQLGQAMANQPGPSFLETLISGLIQSAIRDALLDLFNNQPAGQYELYPPCPNVSEGEEVVPDVASWSESTNPMIDLQKRMDALALLIQYHKDQGQPSCKTAITGRPVTVDFISDPE